MPVRKIWFDKMIREMEEEEEKRRIDFKEKIDGVKLAKYKRENPSLKNRLETTFKIVSSSDVKIILSNIFDLITSSIVQKTKGFPFKGLMFFPGNLLLPPLAGIIQSFFILFLFILLLYNYQIYLG